MIKNIFSKKKHKIGEKFTITNRRTGQQMEATVIRDYGDASSGPITTINGEPIWRDYYQVECHEPLDEEIPGEETE
jgi:hypothetical protein